MSNSAEPCRTVVRTHPEADRQPIRVACSSRVGTTKFDAALEAKRRVATALGSAALEAAEERVRVERAAAAAAAAEGPPAKDGRCFLRKNAILTIQRRHRRGRASRASSLRRSLARSARAPKTYETGCRVAQHPVVL